MTDVKIGGVCESYDQIVQGSFVVQYLAQHVGAGTAPEMLTTVVSGVFSETRGAMPAHARVEEG
jgi:hypothetical protein